MRLRRLLLKLHVRALRLKLFAEREILSAEQFDCRDRLVPWRFSSENSMSGSRPDTEGIDVVSAVSRQGHVAAMVFRPRMVLRLKLFAERGMLSAEQFDS